jgi:LPXTG-motif cell wall-anchored protein
VPVPDLSVAWSFVSSQTGDKIATTPTTTNAQGVATTTVTLAATTGERTIRASTAAVSASAVVSQLCGGLPRTSTLPTTGVQFPTLILVLGMLALGAGAWLAVRRQA